MSDDEISQAFEAVNDDYIKFERIENPPFSSPDLCAFALLDKLFPSDKNEDMICGAEHDEYWLRIEQEDIEKLTEEQILYLVRCGVRYDSEVGSLTFFA